jgi:hypothetical protein
VSLDALGIAITQDCLHSAQLGKLIQVFRR